MCVLRITVDGGAAIASQPPVSVQDSAENSAAPENTHQHAVVAGVRREDGEGPAVARQAREVTAVAVRLVHRQRNNASIAHDMPK